jgi:hypothetical protein
MHSESCVAGVRGALSQVLAEIAETDRGWGLGKGAPFPKPRPQGANCIARCQTIPLPGITYR